MSSAFLEFAVQIALLFLSASLLLTVFKVVAGPTLPDRILALDMLVAVAIGFIAVIGIKTGYTLYLDIAIALGLVGFLATVAFARFILSRGMTESEDGNNQPALKPKAVPTTAIAAAPAKSKTKSVSNRRAAPKQKPKRKS